MNSDIRISLSFRNHRKRYHLERLLGSVGATRYLLDLWLTAAQQRPDGKLKGWSAQDIALAGGYPGKPQKFIDSLLQSGFLDQDGDGYRLHDWADHQPWCCGAPRRSEQARKAALERWAGTRQAPDTVPPTPRQAPDTATFERKSDAPSIEGHMPRLRTLAVPSPLPSPDPEQEPDPLLPAHAPALIFFRNNIQEDLTPYREKEIMRAVEKYGLNEVLAAIKEAFIYNKLSWGYCREVLDGRAARGEMSGREGRGEKEPTTGGGRGVPTKYTPAPEEEE